MIFTSKYLGLNIVIKPTRTIHDAVGNKSFSAGKRVEFVNGIFETQDQEIIDYLIASPRKGIDYIVFNDGKADAQVSAAGQEQIEAEKAAVETTVHSCPKCAFKAKNKFGLDAHIRAKHPVVD